MSATCPDELLREALERLARDDAGGLEEIEKLVGDYPGDARLYFLHGSLLAAARRYGEARTAMTRAVEIAPDYGIARFQLGFLAFTSGDAASASAAWEPLLKRDAGDSLRLFAEGLQRLAVDDFAAAADLLHRGMAANQDNPALNADMARLLEAIEAERAPADGEAEPLSLTQLALRQSAARSTRH
jgi:tetratricopeptide (TPR) repeat protein